MFSHRTEAGEYSIARRGGQWYLEFDGEVHGPFLTPEAAATKAVEGTLRRADGSVLPAPDVPADLSAWRRGSQLRRQARDGTVAVHAAAHAGR